MHLLTGSGCRQVCDIFMTSLVKSRLMGFLCLLLLCRLGTICLSGLCQRHIPVFHRPLLCAWASTCRPAQINARHVDVYGCHSLIPR